MGALYGIQDSGRGHGPLEQGFEAGSYDVVVASNVLHATKRMDVTMSRVRSLLRPGGSLILVEIPPRGAVVGLVAGSLTGWWAHEDEFSSRHPADASRPVGRDSLEEWFRGIHSARGSSHAVSKAVSSLSNGVSTKSRVVVVRHGLDDRVDKISRESPLTILRRENARGNSLTSKKRSLYVVIDSAEQSLLLDPPPHLFKAINALLSAKSNVLWVVLQDTADSASTAYKGSSPSSFAFSGEKAVAPASSASTSGIPPRNRKRPPG